MKKKLVAVTALFCAALLGLSACGSAANNAASDSKAASSQTDKKADDSKQADDNKGNFEEHPIGHVQEHKPYFQVGVVYFQPVDMEPKGMSLPAADSACHFEADIHALKGNELGYDTDEYIPDLNVKYEIKNLATGHTLTGTLMQMNADDGPHYGVNLPKEGFTAGKYEVKLTIKSPESNGWMLHVDKGTGVKGRFWKEPIVDTRIWNYTPQQW